MAEILQGVDATSICSRALAQLPVTRKHELLARQGPLAPALPAAPCDPFGGFATIGWRAAWCATVRRVYQSPARSTNLKARQPPTTGAARAMAATGFAAGDSAQLL